MNSLYFIIPIAIVFCALAIKAFFWAIDNRQFDDLESEGKRILFDDDIPPPAGSKSLESSKENPADSTHD